MLEPITDPMRTQQLPPIPVTSKMRLRRGQLRRLRRTTTQSPQSNYGRLGTLEVRLALRKSDVKRAQRLRYQVFYQEMSARPTLTSRIRQLDVDPFDGACDHLIVEDTAVQDTRRAFGAPRVVGTYRVLRQENAARIGGFYSDHEFDVSRLIAQRPGERFLELGRSCVLKPYRNKRTIELLWHGLWTYACAAGVDVMIGCASFAGTQPSQHRAALSYLHHYALAPPPWRTGAHIHRRARLDLLPAAEIDTKASLKAMPPLIKAYLRVGAWIGEGAVVDHQFGTTDVLMILPIERIKARYLAHFGSPEELGGRLAA